VVTKYLCNIAHLSTVITAIYNKTQSPLFTYHRTKCTDVSVPDLQRSGRV